jgi:tetratricopeptide (TPR) repeat protein
MKPRVGIVQFHAVCPEGNEHPLGCGITYEIARRLTTMGGVDANAILLGNRGAVAGPEFSAEVPLSVETATGLSVPNLGAQYESDFIVLGNARIADGLLLHYRIFDVASGCEIHEGCVSGLRTSVFRLLDDLAHDARKAIGQVADEEEEQDPNPVYERVDFEAFVEYCLGREEDRPANSMDHLERALRLEPGFRMALVEYLSFCYQVDDPSGSLAAIDAYLKLNPDDHEILIAAANLCLAFHRVDDGLRYAHLALMQRPDDVEPRVIMARFLFAKEMPAEARVHLDAALRSADSSPEALYCLGRYFLDLGDYYRSREYFERSLAVDSGFYVALRDLQCCYYELGDFAQGIEACERLLEADPTDAGSHYNLGLIYQRLGRTQLAVKFFQEAVRQDPTFYKAIFMVAEHHYANGRWDEALKRFEEAHRVSSESAEALGRIGDCHHQLGRVREAFRFYTWARREDPLFESARHVLIEGAALAREGDLEGGRRLILKATELDENLAEAWNELGWVLLRLGRAEEAMNVVRRAVELEPEHPGLLLNLLACCRRLSLGVRVSAWARELVRDTGERLRRLNGRGVVPQESARRRHRRLFTSLTWYALRG